MLWNVVAKIVDHNFVKHIVLRLCGLVPLAVYISGGWRAIITRQVNIRGVPGTATRAPNCERAQAAERAEQCCLVLTRQRVLLLVVNSLSLQHRPLHLLAHFLHRSRRQRSDWRQIANEMVLRTCHRTERLGTVHSVYFPQCKKVLQSPTAQTIYNKPTSTYFHSGSLQLAYLITR